MQVPVPQGGFYFAKPPNQLIFIFWHLILTVGKAISFTTNTIPSFQLLPSFSYYFCHASPKYRPKSSNATVKKNCTRAFSKIQHKPLKTNMFHLLAEVMYCSEEANLISLRKGITKTEHHSRVEKTLKSNKRWSNLKPINALFLLPVKLTGLTMPAYAHLVQSETHCVQSSLLLCKSA